jgi:hypothetical protein
LVIDREIGDQSSEGNDLWNLSLALDRLGQRKAALAQAEAALRAWEAAGELPADVERVHKQVAEWKVERQTGEAEEG